MSFDPLIKALEENPALAEELGNAKTPRERDAILDAHGIEKPGPDSQFPEAGGHTAIPLDRLWGRRRISDIPTERTVGF
jgi:hypothetical protein